VVASVTYAGVCVNVKTSRRIYGPRREREKAKEARRKLLNGKHHCLHCAAYIIGVVLSTRIRGVGSLGLTERCEMDTRFC
jgi:hypothetical protein